MAFEIWWTHRLQVLKVSLWIPIVKIINKFSLKKTSAFYLKITIFGYLSVAISLMMMVFRFVQYTLTQTKGFLRYSLIFPSSTTEIHCKHGTFCPSAKWFLQNRQLTMIRWNGCFTTFTRSHRNTRLVFLCLDMCCMQFILTRHVWKIRMTDSNWPRNFWVNRQEMIFKGSDYRVV